MLPLRLPRTARQHPRLLHWAPEFRPPPLSASRRVPSMPWTGRGQPRERRSGRDIFLPQLPMTDPKTVSADYTFPPAELAQTLALLLDARQPVVVRCPHPAAPRVRSRKRSTPAFLPPSDDPGRWLINLEELPFALPMVRATLNQLVLDRKSGQHECRPARAVRVRIAQPRKSIPAISAQVDTGPRPALRRDLGVARTPRGQFWHSPAAPPERPRTMPRPRANRP